MSRNHLRTSRWKCPCTRVLWVSEPCDVGSPPPLIRPGLICCVFPTTHRHTHTHTHTHARTGERRGRGCHLQQLHPDRGGTHTHTHFLKARECVCPAALPCVCGCLVIPGGFELFGFGVLGVLLIRVDVVMKLVWA